MPSTNPRGDNPEGLAEFEPMENARYAAAVQAYSDRLRRVMGRRPLASGPDLRQPPERPLADRSQEGRSPVAG